MGEDVCYLVKFTVVPLGHLPLASYIESLSPLPDCIKHAPIISSSAFGGGGYIFTLNLYISSLADFKVRLEAGAKVPANSMPSLPS